MYFLTVRGEMQVPDEQKIAFQKDRTGCLIGRLELLGTADVLEALRAPHPAFLPIQLGAFAAAGAVWGADPYGGPPRPGGDWPRAALNPNRAEGVARREGE